jgi:hypothetical protein
MHAGSRRSTTLQLALVAGFAYAGLAHGADAERFRILYAERAAFEDVAQRADASGMTAAASTRATRTRFDAYGRRFDLKLEANDRVLGAVASGTQAQVWRGSLDGIPGSWARLTVANGRRYGMVWDGRDLYVIEPAADAGASLVGPAPATGDATVVYRLSDTLAPSGGAACATASPGHDGATTGLQAYSQMVGELRAAAATAGDTTTTATPATAGATATKRIQVSVVADFEYEQQLGVQGARDRIVARFNNIDGIFASQVGVQVELASTPRVYETPVQPFTSTDPNSLLNEVSTYRQQLLAGGGTSGGLTHLITGRNLDGTTVGIAFIGALCSTKYGVSLSEGLNSFGDLIAAHELGHNFGAPHDGETPTSGVNACSAVTQTYLMSPRINGSNQFSQCSLDQMAPQVAKATCLLPATPPPTVDLGVDPSNPVRALVDRTFALKSTVTNAGTVAASNGRLQITMPAGLAVTLATPSDAGSCSAQAGMVTCAWPTVAAGGSVSVALELRASALGNYAIVARTQVTSDASAANDSATYTATVDPLPDLALDVPATSASANTETATTVTAGARNPGATAADGGTLTFDLPPQVQAGATLPTGCTAAASRVTCTLGSVPAGQTVSVALPIRGLAAGSGTVALTLASPDDATTSNNTGSIAVTVAAASAPAPTPSTTPATAAPVASAASSGGGGSFGLLELGALCALIGLRRRVRRA